MDSTLSTPLTSTRDLTDTRTPLRLVMFVASIFTLKSSTMTAATVSTRITSLFKCKYPIVLPGMSWISTPELVAAVSNAGGIGILATGELRWTLDCKKQMCVDIPNS